MSIPPLPKGLPDTAETRVANALHSLSIRLLRRARAADRETGLGPERLSLLSVLVYAGPQSVGALAAIEDVSPPAVSRIVAALEAQGLAARARDGRMVTVRATAKGKRLMEEGRRRRLELIAKDLAGLGRADLATLKKAAGVLARPGAKD